MNPFIFAYNELLFRPLFNLLVGITNLLPGHNVGVSIILVTLLVRLVLLPSMVHQARQMHRNQQKMAELKEQLDKIQKKHKNDKSKKAEATMQLYKEAGINPASGCLPLLIQLPILLALYRVFLEGFDPNAFVHLYSFVSQPDQASLIFLGIDLTTRSVILAALAGVLQFILMRGTISASPTAPSNDKNAEMMQSMQKNMMYIFPVMTVFISLQLAGALSLYWVATTVFGIIQQYIFKKYLKITSSVAV